MEARACSLLLDEMARSQEGDVVGTSRVVVRETVPKATSSGGEPKSVTDSLSGVTQTRPIASTSETTIEDGENSANNGSAGGGVGSDSQTLSSLQASVKLWSDQMAWFVDKLTEPEAELDATSVVRDGAPDCVQPELAEEGEIVDALNELGNTYADLPIWARRLMDRWLQ